MDGILIIDKPAGITSHDVVWRARKILKEKRIGHTGTLDPFATGVLVLLVGQATRLAQFLNSDVKEYEGCVRFGYETDTGDLTGRRRQETGNGRQETGNGKREEECSENERPITKDKGQRTKGEIENALSKLRGEILQKPPMYSAKKIKGKKLYELAREGEVVEREAVPVTIYEFVAVEKDGKLLRENEDETIDMDVRVKCSAGTYIRTLAESLGENLGVGAHLASLRRTKAGDFGIESSVTLEELQEALEKNDLDKILLPMKTALSKLRSLHLTSADAKRVSNGVALRIENKSWRDAEAVSLFDNEGNLIAIAFYNEASRNLKPNVVFQVQQ